MTLKTDLLNAIDKALEPSGMEQLRQTGRQLLAEVRRLYGDGVAETFATSYVKPRTQEQMKNLIAQKRPAPKPVAEVPQLLPPKPTPAPAMSTSQLNAALFDAVRFELPYDFAELDEHAQRRAMLRAVWRCHAEDALPMCADEIADATKGMKRFPASVGAAAAAFRRQAITRRIKKLKITAQ